MHMCYKLLHVVSPTIYPIISHPSPLPLTPSPSLSHPSSPPLPLTQSVPYFFLFILLEAVVRALQHKPLPRINDSINSLSAGTILMLSEMCTAAVEMVTYSWAYGTFQLVELPWDSVWTWLLTFVGVDLGYYWFHRMAHGEGRGGEERGRKGRGRKERGRKGRGRKERGRKERGKKERGRKERGRKERGRKERRREEAHASVFLAEVNLFWAAHQAHHSSEDYTLSTALRQSAVQRFNSWVRE